MNDLLVSEWRSAIDEVAQIWDARLRAGKDLPWMDQEKEAALDKTFDDAHAAGNLPGAIMAISAWKREWLKFLNVEEEVSSV